MRIEKEFLSCRHIRISCSRENKWLTKDRQIFSQMTLTICHEASTRTSFSSLVFQRGTITTMMPSTTLCRRLSTAIISISGRRRKTNLSSRRNRGRSEDSSTIKRTCLLLQPPRRSTGMKSQRKNTMSLLPSSSRPTLSTAIHLVTHRLQSTRTTSGSVIVRLPSDHSVHQGNHSTLRKSLGSARRMVFRRAVT